MKTPAGLVTAALVTAILAALLLIATATRGESSPIAPPAPIREK